MTGSNFLFQNFIVVVLCGTGEQPGGAGTSTVKR